jgi:hypothetical protein
MWVHSVLWGVGSAERDGLQGLCCDMPVAAMADTLDIDSPQW